MKKLNKRTYRKKSRLNLKTYIASGVLELYVLDVLGGQEKIDVERMLAIYPELVTELNKIQESIAKQAIENAVEAPIYLRKQIFDSIDNLQKEKLMDINDLPLINQFSSHHNWLNFIHTFGTFEPIDGRFVKVLRQDDHVTQMLIIAETSIEEETHEGEYESFLILSGECKCTIGTKVRLMKAGDFMEIPLYEPHSVALLSPQVTAILQHVRI